MRNAIRSSLLLGSFLLVLPSLACAHVYQRYPYPYPPYPMMVNTRSAVRIEVSPKDAEVYVDGYYAGIVDDFDGSFQRLRVIPGAHQIVIRREGFHSVKEDVYVTPGVVYRIRRTMEPLSPGEADEPRPTPMAPPPGGGRPGEYPPSTVPPVPPRSVRPPIQRMPPPEPPHEPAAVEPMNTGALVIRVQPGDAEIFIDGERWQGPQGDERLVVQLPEGSHHVEVRKEGFAAFSTDVQVRRVETVPLNVSLSRQK